MHCVIQYTKISTQFSTQNSQCLKQSSEIHTFLQFSFKCCKELVSYCMFDLFTAEQHSCDSTDDADNAIVHNCLM